jgi:CheY-like chemotaxis protein
MNAERRRVVLVVDDEEDVRTFLTAVLEDEGFEVMCASDGDEALERVKERVPDLVSLDLVMPRKSGIRFLHELRRSREWSHIPVLIVTGHARDEIGRQDFEHVMDGKYLSGRGSYLEKPVNAASFLAAVKRELGIVGEEPASSAAAAAGDEDVRKELGKLLERADSETLRRLRSLLIRDPET